MIVVDTSAVVDLLTGWPPLIGLRSRLSDDGDLHAPHLLDVEFLHVLWRLVHSGVLSSDRAEDARGDFNELAITRYPHLPLADRIWELRGGLTASDTVFIAVNEALDTALVTTDAWLARAPGHAAAVENYPPASGHR